VASRGDDLILHNISPSSVATPPVKRQLSKKGIAFVVFVIAAALVALQITHQYDTNDSVKRQVVSESPDYQTILPQGKSINELGGWKRVSPPKNEPVYAYGDKIGDIAISVSQQPLPSSFETDTGGHIRELAKGYNATDKITAGSTNVYIGTSAKGPQSVIFTKADLLILIKSQKKIDQKEWSAYIAALNLGSDPSAKF